MKSWWQNCPEDGSSKSGVAWGAVNFEGLIQSINQLPHRSRPVGFDSFLISIRYTPEKKTSFFPVICVQWVSPGYEPNVNARIEWAEHQTIIIGQFLTDSLLSVSSILVEERSGYMCTLSHFPGAETTATRGGLTGPASCQPPASRG